MEKGIRYQPINEALVTQRFVFYKTSGNATMAEVALRDYGENLRKAGYCEAETSNALKRVMGGEGERGAA